MKLIHNLIIIFLCLMILGFFASFAQNSYGSEIIAICLGFISLLLFSKAFVHIRHKKQLSWMVPVSFCLLLFSSFLSEFLGDTDQIKIPMFMLGTFLPTLIFSIVNTLLNFRKKATEQIPISDYYFSIFFGLFCLGLFLKLLHQSGASVIMVSGGFLLLPITVRVIKFIVKSIKEKNSAFIVESELHLFLGIIFTAFIFKFQHWPGANNLIVVSYFILFLFFLHLLIKEKWSGLIMWFSKQMWSAKTAFFCFLVIIVYYNLAKNNLAPKTYSNEFPPAYQEMLSKENDVTAEGRMYKKKAEIYHEYYFLFLENLEKEKK